MNHLISGWGRNIVSIQERIKLNFFIEFKIKVCSSLNEYFEAHFQGSYKGLQITQKLTCTNIKHVYLLQPSSVLNVNYKIRKIHSDICLKN